MKRFFIDSTTLNVINSAVFGVYKPKGLSSAETLEILKALVSQDKCSSRSIKLRAGHGGTLDKAATGVLVVAFCGGCKLLTKYLNECKKTYEVIGELGVSTDTYNSEGRVLRRSAYDHISKDMFLQEISKYVGTTLQYPPKFSALKKSGVRLSDLARMGIEVTVPGRIVTCFSIECIYFDLPFFKLKLETGSGFYVRSLIYDIGLGLSCCAHVKELERTKQGEFCKADCVNVDCSRDQLLAAISSQNSKH